MIIRIEHNQNNSHIVLNKKVFEDPHLSWGAKGLWANLKIQTKQINTDAYPKELVTELLEAGLVKEVKA